MFIMVARLREYLELSRGDVSNLRPMEGLRGFAVFLVFLVHYSSLVEPWVSSASLLKFSDALHDFGGGGVDLFFVLSGYLIYGSLISRPQRFLSFFKRRVVRIYPVFIVVFVLYVFLSFLFPAQNKIPKSVWDGFVYLLANFLMLPGLFPIKPMITVAWSLSYEMFYYLIIPFLIYVLSLRDWTPGRRVFLFLMLGFALVLYCMEYGGPVRLVMFISGILLFEALSNTTRFHIDNAVAFLLLVVGMGCLLFADFGHGEDVIKALILFLVFFVLCYACLQTTRGWLSDFFSWAPMRWLGNMSYSYYLFHGLTLKAGFLLVAILVPPASRFGDVLFWLLLPIFFGLTLLSSFLLFIIVERPLSLTR